MSININITYKNKENNNENNEKLFTFLLSEKIIDIKNKILDYYNNNNNNKYNYIELENITSKIYKDYGKLFFDKGILPSSNDNYKLENFTIIDNNRIYNFIAILQNVEKKIKKENEQKNHGQKNHGQKNYEQKNYEQKNYEQKNYGQKYEKKNDTKESFIFKEEDFPPLC